jgi:hypothetical protein
MNRQQAILAVAASVLAGCGRYTDPGTGTHTLFVKATLAYQFGNSTTAVGVTVIKANTAVGTAYVTVKDPDSNATTTVPPENQNNGTYKLALPGWHRRIELAVVDPPPPAAMTDYLDVKLEGPGPHRITAPNQGDLVSYNGLGSGLEVDWATTDGLKADLVSLSLRFSPFTTKLTDDTGSTTIPKASLAQSLNNTETVHVMRQNQVTPAGGTAGSSMVLSYEVNNDFNLQP